MGGSLPRRGARAAAAAALATAALASGALVAAGASACGGRAGGSARAGPGDGPAPGRALATVRLVDASVPVPPPFPSQPGGPGTMGTLVPTYEIPALLEVKLLAIELAEDLAPLTGLGRGATTFLWVNPACGDDLAGCGVDPGTAPDGAALRVVDGWVDLAAGTDAVGAALASAPRDARPGTYRHALLHLCTAPPRSPNLRWRAAAMAAPGAVHAACAVATEAFDPPLVLAPGDRATVALAYDLGAAVSGYPAGPVGESEGCASVGGTQYCFQLPRFTLLRAP